MLAAQRGELPFAALHGEPLLAHALRAAGAVSEGEVLVVVDEAGAARRPTRWRARWIPAGSGR